ncbi:MAG: hypothetical protein HY881_01355 [Deltaproteobacteria bacterium]|nr:hypothetical protein [Deltaproteobacteria bacterium]
MNPTLSAESHFSGMSPHIKTAAIFRQPTASAQPLLRLNALLDAAILPYEVNEEQIENWLDTLEASGNKTGPIYWLLWIRLMEAALLCAGNYVDNCEFCAAGDLLVNPREIRVHSNDTRPPALKWRHGLLSEQFRINGHSRRHTIETIKNEYRLEITRPPLLPTLFRGLKDSGRISGPYLAHTDRRMRRITDAIGFLASWQIFEAADLHRRTRQATAETRSFIASHLCRFDDRIFRQAGNAVQRMAIDPAGPCDLLST